MMKTFLLLALTLLGFTASTIAQKKDSYIIKGTLEGMSKNDKGRIYLERYNSDFSVDSSRLIQGTFIFKGTTDGPESASIFYIDPFGNRSETLDFFVEKGKTTIRARLGQLNHAEISESLLNQDAQHFSTINKIILDSIDRLTTAYVKAEESLSQDSFRMDSPARSKIALIDASLTKWSQKLNQQQANYVRNNPKKALSLFKLRDLLKESSNKELVAQLYKTLDVNLTSTPLGQEIKTQLDNLENLKLGDLAPDFSLADTTDKQINLSDFRGQYVLVDFWASWCVPCRIENEHVQKTYDAFKDQGFEVLGVSTDFSIHSWKKAVSDDQMTWINVVDPDGAVSSQYHVKSIPSNFLIDPNGKIIGQNLRGENLYETIKNTLQKN